MGVSLCGGGGVLATAKCTLLWSLLKGGCESRGRVQVAREAEK
jgi:hypothetical protein